MLGECPIVKHGGFKLQAGSLDMSVGHQTLGDRGVNSGWGAQSCGQNFTASALGQLPG